MCISKGNNPIRGHARPLHDPGLHLKPWPLSSSAGPDVPVTPVAPVYQLTAGPTDHQLGPRSSPISPQQSKHTNRIIGGNGPNLFRQHHLSGFMTSTKLRHDPGWNIFTRLLRSLPGFPSHTHFLTDATFLARTIASQRFSASNLWN